MPHSQEINSVRTIHVLHIIIFDPKGNAQVESHDMFQATARISYWAMDSPTLCFNPFVGSVL